MKSLFLAILLIGILVFGCTSSINTQGTANTSLISPPVQKTSSTNAAVMKGDTVEIDYVGSFENGTVFDTSLQDEAQKAGLSMQHAYGPITFVPGTQQLINGVEDGVLGMKEGDERSIIVKPDDAYGQVREDLVLETNKSKISTVTGEELRIGMQIHASNGMSGTIIDMTNETVKIDFNHPLAGQTLRFKLIVRKIIKAS